MAQLIKKPYPLPPLDYGVANWQQSEHYIKMRWLQDNMQMIKFSVGDGFAHYLVVSMKPLKLQHVPFGDGYKAHDALIRGLRKVDVEEIIARQKRGWNF